ncbi:MAG: hypothetical protein A2735_03080 [Candidatus Yanofskybacteria bacterium RIFCSPHIGHO2_01_FULL_41_21]|uniref:Uncharacterized protein n=1 Tax=Candidatus Yanofskybacteria bacterium RIFCSPHIGHO2_01_FULL_41_21 TaxID=1802660 RepID=A0A1F8E8Y1_9BACT|nr:MAG: hypothetical protein A2735_03080 [Candidatus Yanofskybacteria bacterium RIFCSPHIGHO2_01_FULL_41_21]
MEDISLENLNKTTDPVLQEQQGYPLDTDSDLVEKRPELFTKIKKKTIKVVSLYLQLLWNANPNGKTINVMDLILNSQTLFGTKFETKDRFTIRHIASDLREIYIFMDPTSLKKWYKNIDTERPDISSRIDLSREIKNFLSEIVHLNYRSSHEAVKKVSKLVKDLDKEDLDIPDQFDRYIDHKTFEDSFDAICVIFIFNFYKIFAEFLYDEGT